VSAKPAKLVHTGKPSENNIILYLDMTSERGIVGENSVTADAAIMGDMDIGHDPVVISNPGDATTCCRTTVDGTELPDSIAVTDFQDGFRLTVEFLVLRILSDRAILKYLIVFADTRRTFYEGIRTDMCALEDLYLRADDRIGIDINTLINPCFRMDNGTGGYQASGSTTVVRNSADATILPSTVAAAENFHMFLRTVRKSTLSSN